MAEDLNGQHARPEQPAAAWESSLLMDGDASTPGSYGSQSSSKPSRRVCSRPNCTRVLGSFLHDPHSVCVNCRDICNPGKRCDECSTWSSDKVLAAYKYQCGLRHRKCAKAKHSHSSVAPFCNVSCDVSVLSQDDLTAGDLASQQGTKPPVAIDLSLFFEVLAGGDRRFAWFCGPPPTATDPYDPGDGDSRPGDRVRVAGIPAWAIESGWQGFPLWLFLWLVGRLSPRICYPALDLAPYT
ncbi:hypothetical protein E2C01_090334 [Portunus trituberculatus]|uniref:Uncharacterized protein n=1 Tax=Portunus trituberculatus TaxID=210409 RepID=A0A5B7JQ19_PORTR|nr:hypothetical protein [Portunus trituberculatus]